MTGAASRFPRRCRFAPVPPDELTRRLGGHFEEVLNAARGSLSEISKPAQHAQVWNAEGYAACKADRCRLEVIPGGH